MWLDSPKYIRSFSQYMRHILPQREQMAPPAVHTRVNVKVRHAQEKLIQEQKALGTGLLWLSAHPPSGSHLRDTAYGHRGGAAIRLRGQSHRHQLAQWHPAAS